MDRGLETAYLLGKAMKYKNRLKRIADILEKVGVAGVALALYQDHMTELWFAAIFLLLSIILTEEAD